MSVQKEIRGAIRDMQQATIAPKPQQRTHDPRRSKHIFPYLSLRYAQSIDKKDVTLLSIALPMLQLVTLCLYSPVEPAIAWRNPIGTTQLVYFPCS